MKTEGLRYTYVSALMNLVGFFVVVFFARAIEEKKRCTLLLRDP